jgi:hypothetical protein
MQCKICGCVNIQIESDKLENCPYYNGKISEGKLKPLNDDEIRFIEYRECLSCGLTYGWDNEK